MLPSRPSDAGPDCRTCPDCGVIYSETHDCTALWDWQDWLYAAEEATREAIRAETEAKRNEWCERIVECVAKSRAKR